MPGDTWNDILTTFEFADKMVNHDKLLDYALFSIATPLPGTEMFETAMNMNVIPKDFKPENFYGFGKGVINTEEWTAYELQMKRAMEWDRINFPASRIKSLPFIDHLKHFTLTVHLRIFIYKF